MISKPPAGHGDDPASPVGESGPQPKRRKIRKGTQSCWECKRRKVRCTYARPTDSICDGCRSRHTECISQEFEDDASSASPTGRESARQSRAVEGQSQPYSKDTPGNEASPRAKGHHEDGPTIDRACLSHSLLSSSTHLSQNEISHALIEIWPSEEELGFILSIPVQVSTLYHGIICKSYSHFFSDEVYEAPRELLKLPPSGSHPVFIARKLLLLASWLQGIPQNHSATIESHRKENYYVYSSQLVGTVSKLVTNQDELVNSVEGIECIMIESMYLNNGGHLRRAWFTNRKAMAIAQMLGLDQEASASDAAYLDAKSSRLRIDTGYMWLRLVLSDRYLSLMLGLPPGTLDNVFATTKALTDCADIERFERMMGVAAGLILQRNQAERLDIAHTQNIDALLQEAAACKPPQWWSGDTLRFCELSEASEDFQQSIRLVNQIAYHHLLIQLHLPYMLQQPPPTTSDNYDYSKMAAAIASRAILAQFVDFRTSETSSAYCRGIDFIAFTASMTLCLAHIECGRCRYSNPRGHISGSGYSAFHALRHQRLSDRGLIERTLQIMDGMAARSKDVVARKISELLGPLLQLENDSASGVEYRVSHSTSSDVATSPESQWTSVVSGEGTSSVLSVQIPYFGSVKIERSPDSGRGSNDPGVTISRSEDSVASVSEQAAHGDVAGRCDSSSSQLAHPAQCNQQSQGPNVGTHRFGYEITAAQPSNPDWQAVPSSVDHLNPRRSPAQASTSQVIDGEDQPTTRPSLHTVAGPADANLLVSGLDAELEDWVLQGVDAAFFGSLLSD
ncbi:hypothetical protein PG990_001718 [Apiospora arundinis]